MQRSFSIAGTYHSDHQLGRQPGIGPSLLSSACVWNVPDRAQTAGVMVVLNGVQLPALDREKEDGTWFRTPVTRKQLESSPVTTVEFQREPGNLTAGKVIWGYSYRPTAGVTASRYFDGERWHEADLAPATPGMQTGRYIVELWLFDRYDRVVMAWY